MIPARLLPISIAYHVILKDRRPHPCQNRTANLTRITKPPTMTMRTQNQGQRLKLLRRPKQTPRDIKPRCTLKSDLLDLIALVNPLLVKLRIQGRLLRQFRELHSFQNTRLQNRLPFLPRSQIRNPPLNLRQLLRRILRLLRLTDPQPWLIGIQNACQKTQRPYQRPFHPLIPLPPPCRVQKNAGRRPNH